MNWARGQAHFLEVWPQFLVLSLTGVILTHFLFWCFWSRGSRWTCIWTFLLIGLGVFMLAPGFARTPSDPLNILTVYGPVYLYPLCSLYLAAKMLRARGDTSRNRRLLPTMAVVTGAWGGFFLFYFVLYQ